MDSCPVAIALLGNRLPTIAPTGRKHNKQSEISKKRRQVAALHTLCDLLKAARDAPARLEPHLLESGCLRPLCPSGISPAGGGEFRRTPYHMGFTKSGARSPHHT